MQTRLSRQPLAALLATLILLLSRPASAAGSYSFVTQWGSAGSAPGQFTYPYGLAADKSGNLFVADAGNNRIQEFSSTGALRAYWGSGGVGAGQFNWPQGIAVDAQGNVYVTDVLNHRIEKFSASGTYLTQWGQHGRADGYFDSPTGVAVDPSGYVYTAESCQDSCNLRIQRFTSTGAFVSKWPGQSAPWDLATDRAGNVFVVDDNSVVKYSIYGTKLGQWGSFGTGPGRFDLPAGLCVDDSGYVYVADTGNHRIQKFTGSGTFVTQWGSYGTGPGQFRFPADVAVDNSGDVYVSDQVNQRIQKFRIRRVLLVHGICGQASDWDPFAQVLSDSGFVVDRLQYGSSGYSLRPAAYVRALAAKLDSMGPGPIAVVAHSMGGLITREYIRRQNASGRVSKVTQLVTLGTPHHGSDFLAWALEKGRGLDLECAKRLPGQTPCHAFDMITPMLGCLGDAYSRPALLDMVPGAWFLNRLNYGADSAHYDSPASRGWSVHQPETGLSPGVYYATVAGTGSFCFSNPKDRVWGKGAAYRENDCTVAVASAMLTSSSAFRSRDVDLPLSNSLAHSSNALTFCYSPYYASQALARKVVRVLLSSPSSPPVGLPSEATDLAPLGVAAESEDSLQTIPAVADSVPAGQLATQAVTIPATTLLSVTLVSTDAHLTLQDPNGTILAASDTSTVSGLSYFSAPGGGMENFELAGPLAGTWTIRVDATASAALQQYGCVVGYATNVATRLAPRKSVIFTGDSIRVLGSVIAGGSLRADLSWTCRVVGPDGLATVLPLHDDGAHGDSLANDGIYGGVLAPIAGIGSYRIVGSAAVPGRGEFVAGSDCELAEHSDLAIQSSDIMLSRNTPLAGDSLTVFATVHNYGPVAALGVEVEISDLATGALLGSTTVDIPTASAATVQASWVVAAPDSHTIQVQVSPFVLDEADYANNSASRLMVVGEPLGVGPPRPVGRGVRFYPPRPNPTAGSVVLTFVMPRSGSAALGVFDVLGRRVHNWSWPMLEPGTHSITWNGRGPSGTLLTPGVYLCRLEVDGQNLQHKVVLRR